MKKGRFIWLLGVKLKERIDRLIFIQGDEDMLMQIRSRAKLQDMRIKTDSRMRDIFQGRYGKIKIQLFEVLGQTRNRIE